MSLQSGQLAYLANNPIYNEEKPFACAFETHDIPGAKSTNQEFDDHVVQIADARTSSDLTLDTSGFEILNSELPFDPAMFEDEDLCEFQYFPIVAQLLQQNFGYSRVIFSDRQLRKRHPDFPENAGLRVKHPQPLPHAHTDYTERSSQLRLSQLIRSDKLVGLEDTPYDQLNIWRVLKGPNNDWPLALCDYRSIDKENDPLRSDIIYRDLPSENWLIHNNPNHQWYYVPNQGPDEIFVFRNSSSPGRTAPVAFHSAFQPRESIELRVFAFL